MFKAKKPNQPNYKIKQFPHCDSRILHAPGECEVCDMHPEWQALRLVWRIAFTGWTPEMGDLPCPANSARGEDVDKQWPGNVPLRFKN